MHVLDNPVWAALNSYHAHFSQGGALARRYVDQIAQIAGVGQSDAAAMDELATLVAPGSSVSLPATVEGLVPLVREPLRLKFTKTLVQMICERPPAMPPTGLELVALSEADVPEMLALTSLTQPGPFRPQTYALGIYLGIRVDGVLAAMGGQRMHLPGYREVSAICTHPDFRGRGYARAIVARLVALVFEEQLTPFLHVEAGKEGAQALYTSLGFVERARLPVVVLEKEGGSEEIRK